MMSERPPRRAGSVRQRDGAAPQHAEPAPADPSAGRPPATDPPQTLRWHDLLSLRVWIRALLLGVVAGGVAFLLWKPLAGPVAGVVIAFTILASAGPDSTNRSA